MEQYNSYKPSGVEWIGDIPENWDLIKLKYISNLYNGSSLNDNQKELFESSNIDDIAYVSTKDIDYNSQSIEYDNGLRIPKSNTSFKLGKKGSFLLCIEGGSSGKKMGYLEQDVYFVNKLCCFEPKTNSKFQYYYIQTPLFQLQFHSSLSGLIGGVSISLIRNFNTILPPLQEQEQIVNYLDEKTTIIDKLISTKQRKVELLKEQRTTLINQVITKGLNPNVKMKDSGVEWIGEIPESWNTTKLKHTCEIIYGISPPETTYNDKGLGVELVNGPVEYSKTDFGYTRSLKWTTEPKKFCKKGSLLFCLRGSTTGRMNITHKDLSIGRGVCSINSKGSQWYLIYSMFILRIYIQKQISGSTFPSVVKEDVDNFTICNPPINEQKEIVEYLDKHTKEIDDLVSMEQNKIELLKEYRQSLISEVITGKIKVV